MKISIIGPMAAGKTTIGRLLAQKYQWPFYDTDQLIEAKLGMSVSAIFTRLGEAKFRRLEAEILSDVFAQTSDLIIATGGGIVIEALNRSLLQAHSKILFLDISVAQQLKRTEGDTTRPLLLQVDKEAQLRALARARVPLYEELADQRIGVDEKSLAEVLAAIALGLR